MLDYLHKFVKTFSNIQDHYNLIIYNSVKVEARVKISNVKIEKTN